MTDPLSWIKYLQMGRTHDFFMLMLSPRHTADHVFRFATTSRVVDCIFILDIVVQCFIAYQAPYDKGASWVFDQRKIIYRYATTWMLLDLITAFPIDVAVAVYESGSKLQYKVT